MSGAEVPLYTFAGYSPTRAKGWELLKNETYELVARKAVIL